MRGRSLVGYPIKSSPQARSWEAVGRSSADCLGILQISSAVRLHPSRALRFLAETSKLAIVAQDTCVRQTKLQLR
ncbi:hypothetical protein [Microcoleus sp. herbarium12]|uniref:hypothetical protein n=1 Tax=Microcoleus sp. herbarium12 TaxID=3055437 RepID=UPI002FD2C7A9